MSEQLEPMGYLEARAIPDTDGIPIAEAAVLALIQNGADR